MNLLVAGGTGFVGTEIVRQAIQRGHAVRILARGIRSKVKEQWGAEVLPVDITDPVSVARPFADVEALIHTVGIIRETGKQTFENIHIRGTWNLVNAARSVGLKHIIYISALGTGIEARTKYHQTKYQAEQMVINSGITYTIFRPSIIFGPRDEFINLLVKLIKYSPVVPVIGSGKYKLQPISVKDLAFCVIDSLTNPRAKNEIFEVGGSRAFEYDQILEIICKVTGRHRHKIHLPITLLTPAIRIIEKIFPRPPVTAEQLQMLRTDNICEPHRLIETFNIRLTPLEEGIKDYLG